MKANIALFRDSIKNPNLIWIFSFLVLFFDDFLLCSGLELAEDLHKLRVKNGVLWGKLWTLDSKKYRAFFGIPYAEPPLKKFGLRFEKTAPKQPWTSLYSATEFGSACLQFMDFHEDDKFSSKSMKRQSEDCLYLNVFAPYSKATNSPKYPVLVWIHGGSFLAGSGDTGMDPVVIMRNLISKDIILVTLNYRLGPLGFFSTTLRDMRGNIGLWDQIEALKWVQENIKFFGGDTNKVTLMGESAGAASVSMLAVSPIVKGLDLVHSAIIMSGSSLAGWAMAKSGAHDYDIENMYDFMSCEKTFNREDILRGLRGLDIVFEETTVEPEKCNLMNQPMQCVTWDTVKGLLECFKEKANFTDAIFRKALAIELGVSRPVIDDEIIPGSMEELIKQNARMPLMIGVAENEWAAKKLIYYGFETYRPINYQRARRRIMSILVSSFAPSYAGQLSNRTMELLTDLVLHAYMKGRTSHESLSLHEFGEILRFVEADIEFLAPCYSEALLYSQNAMPVYLYSFEHLPKSQIIEEEYADVNVFGSKTRVVKNTKINVKSAFHGLDQAFIFSEGYSSNFKFDFDPETDGKIAYYWSTYIANFVKYGNPTPEPVDNITWTPFTAEKPSYMRIKLPIESVQSDYRWSNVSLWTQYVPEFAKNVASPENRTALPLTDEERVQLTAYKRAWWALWVLVAAVAFVLWTVVICMVAQKCITARSKPYKNIIVANG